MISGTTGLMLVQLFSYAGALGCGIDGVEPGASGIFPIRYFRAYLLDPEEDEQVMYLLSQYHTLTLKYWYPIFYSDMETKFTSTLKIPRPEMQPFSDINKLLILL